MPEMTPDAPQGSTALIIGNFDGAHLGHQKLIERARARIGPQGHLVILCFHPHPMTVLNPNNAPPQIESYPIRCHRLVQAGASQVSKLEPSPTLLAQDPEQFINQIISEYNPSVIVEGHDFHFGRARTGTPTVLKHLAELQGVQADIMGPVKVTLTDQSIVTASSSMTRWLLEQGRVRDVTNVLGRPHELIGTVEQGQQLGRTINIPTINLNTQSMLPADGVYSGFARFNYDGQDHQLPAAINVGMRPTVQGQTRRAEAHILNQDGSSWTPDQSMPDYSWNCTLELVGWVRDQVKFDTIDTLKAQIQRDCRTICSTLAVV